MARFYSRAVLALTLWFISNNHSMGLSPGQVTVCVYGPCMLGEAEKVELEEGVEQKTCRRELRTDRRTDGRTLALIRLPFNSHTSFCGSAQKSWGEMCLKLGASAR